MGYDLRRFKDAQERDYATALAEVRAGRKRSHWIWYVFPQLKGLGRSRFAEYYGIDGLGEAEAYLADELLGARLAEISMALLGLPGSDPVGVLGGIDAVKVRSCMTLFAAVDGSDPVFEAVLAKYYGGDPDPRTLGLIG